VTLADASVTQLIAAGALPAGSTGKLVVSQRPTTSWVASAEYIRGDWLFAAEYGRWLKHQETSLPQLIPAFDEDSERFYAMATYRLSTAFEFGTYYSVTHADVHDRTGNDPKFMPSFRAFQRDLAATIRFDVNEYWLWKLEAHYINGVSELEAAQNPNPEQYWGLFLFRTTVTF
jgi:predicted porin